VRLPDNSIFIKTEKLEKRSQWYNIPIIRGVFIFVASLVTGVKTLMYSAEILESAEVDDDGEAYEKDKMTLWLEKHFGEKGALNAMLYASVVIALVFTVGIFVIGPTLIVNLCKTFTTNEVALNLIEGVFRILLFVLYILLITKMKDIQTVFRFHGAEHECIHCFEGGLPLTPDNCQQYETLHPRCGTSFLMFVMVISLLLFSLLGWPSPLMRIASRLLLIPVIAGLSYELLRWAGSSTSRVVKILSVPGLLLQKLTTMKPNEAQLEVAIAAMNAVLVPEDTPVFEGKAGIDGKPLPEESEASDEPEVVDEDNAGIVVEAGAGESEQFGA
jgi:uncharacterized protein YqhQ